MVIWGMARNRRNLPKAPPSPWYRGANIPMRVIRQFTRRVVERFQPDKIVLFGSYAYGTPHADSDVDILVIMPARNELDQAVRISLAVDYNFPLDLLVRTPNNLSRRLAEGDSFLREVTTRGKVLYEETLAGSSTTGGALARGQDSEPVCRGMALSGISCQ